MIYFDNGATGGYKPRSVRRAVARALQRPANPGRSGHERALAALALTEHARALAGDLCGVSSDRILFAKNCTECLNLAIFGLLPKGAHVVVSAYDHNATLRPLYSLFSRGLASYTVAKPEHGLITLASVRDALKRETAAVVLNCTSNVLGCTAEVEEISAFCKVRGLLLILDGAQFLGHHTVDLSALYYSALAAAPHKTLFAPQGIAFLAARELPKPLLFGGTGTASAELAQPTGSPEGYESGTLNTVGIAGLAAGLEHYLRHAPADAVKLEDLTRYLYENLIRLDRIKVYSAPNRAGIVSFLVKGRDSAELADGLAERGIAVRGGLHCAPLVHRTLGTLESGLVRASLGPWNTEAEVRAFTRAVADLTK